MLRTTPDHDDDSALLARQLDLLKEIAATEYRLDPDVADAIAEDVLIASLRHSSSTEWLAGAMLCAIQSRRKDAE